MNWLRIWLILTTCLYLLPAHADTVLVGTESARTLDVQGAINYLEDPTAGLTYAEVSERLHDFTPLETAAPNFGFTDSTFWFHVSLKNLTSQPRELYLELGYPLLDSIKMYSKKAGKPLETISAGDLLPFSDREISSRTFVFPLQLEKYESAGFMLQIRSSSSMQVPIKLWTPEAFRSNDQSEYFIQGIYFGTLATLFAYNLMLIFWVREATYIYYTVYLIFYSLFQLSLNGLGYRLLWPESPWLAERGIIVFLCLSSITATLFSYKLLSIDKMSLPCRVAGKLMLGVFVALLPVAFLAEYRLNIQLLVPSVLAGCLYFFTASILSIRKGISTARLYLFAWLAFLIGASVLALKSQGILPSNFFTDYAVQIGSTLEVILLSLALSYRFKEFRDQNLKIQAEARDHLEERVEQRTTELKSVLNELSIANARLVGMNNTDTLTGVNSRAFFDSHGPYAWNNTARAAEQICIMMVDVDNFKQVNDNFGHLIGDEVLIAVAKAISKSLIRSSDQVARYGGEEFVIILPSTDLEGALAVAERIRKAIEQVDTSEFGLAAPITASLGVTIEQPSTPESDFKEAIARADNALYCAKNNGKNRVEVYQSDASSAAQPDIQNMQAGGMQ